MVESADASCSNSRGARNEEREELQQLVRAGTTPLEDRECARLVLMAAEGVGTLEIARWLAMAPDALEAATLCRHAFAERPSPLRGTGEV